MARKSRKPQNLPKVEVVKTAYQVAAYVRLSVMDNGKSSDSIELQKATIIDYIDNDSELELYQIYSDNGATGTNFDREGFERMMEDVKSKKVNCIIVKELSRFGRNYIETGNYLEKIFPFLGIRFISIADNFDTFDAEKNEDGYIIPLKNLIHDIYAKDVSRKVATSKRVMQEKGELVGGVPLYGYKRSEFDNHKLVVDEVVAPIVKRIFELRASGLGHVKIIQVLESENIPSPSKYRYQNGIYKKTRFADVPWTTGAIRNILENPIYMGNMVQGKTKQSVFHGHKVTKIDEKDYIVVPNTHEAIISDDLFRIAQEMRNKNRATNNENVQKNSDVITPINLLQGIVYCGDCGGKMSYIRNISNRGDKRHIYYYFACKVSDYYADKCTMKRKQYDVVVEVVLSAIQTHLHVLLNLKDTLSKIQNSKSYSQKKTVWNNEGKRIKDRLLEIRKYKKSLLEKYLSKKISEADYLALSSSYSEEIEELNGKSDELLSEILNVSEIKEKAKWITEFERFSEVNEITSEMIKAVVEKVIIYPNQEINVVLKYQDEFNSLLGAVKGYGGEGV